MILYYFVGIYFLSAIAGWIYLHIYYSSKGLGSKKSGKIGFTEIAMVLIPVLNLVCLFLWIQNPKTGKYIITVKQFFNIKD